MQIEEHLKIEAVWDMYIYRGPYSHRRIYLNETKLLMQNNLLSTQ